MAARIEGLQHSLRTRKAAFEVIDCGNTQEKKQAVALVDVGDCDSVSDPDEAGAFMAWDYLWCGVRVVDYCLRRSSD